MKGVGCLPASALQLGNGYPANLLFSHNSHFLAVQGGLIPSHIQFVERLEIGQFRLPIFADKSALGRPYVNTTSRNQVLTELTIAPR